MRRIAVASFLWFSFQNMYFLPIFRQSAWRQEMIIIITLICPYIPTSFAYAGLSLNLIGSMQRRQRHWHRQKYLCQRINLPRLLAERSCSENSCVF